VQRFLHRSAVKAPGILFAFAEVVQSHPRLGHGFVNSVVKQKGRWTMSDSSIVNLFAQHEFLRGLSERHRMILASGARPFTAKAGQVLAQEGQRTHAFFLIRSGNVVLESALPGGDGLLIQSVGQGEIVGWSWLVPPHVWQFRCRAVDDVEGISFDAQWLRDLCERDESLGYHLLKQLVTVMAQRLAGTRRHLVELYRSPRSA
jgi:CRP/FNR family cyclic AMP-dependent transcriptional regulator